MLVDTENLPESKPEAPAPAPTPAHSQLRVRSDLHEEYSSDEIAKMTELYEGTLSNIEEGEIVKSKVLRVTDTAVILDVEFNILKLNKRRRNIVVSRRVLLEAERKTKRDVLMKELQVGQVRKGIVKNITDFGAFIDLGGVDGLLHITDMSYGRVSHPSEMVKIGQEVEVKVLDIDWERERISLGLKQLQAYPWKNVAAKYPVGTRVQGKVVKKGDEVEVLILNVDAENKRISLGLKQAQEDPWLRIGETYPVGTEMRGRVLRLMDKGVVVDLGQDIEGFVPMSQLGIADIQNPADAVKEGQAVELKVLEVDPIHHRIVLAATGWPKEDATQETGTQDAQKLDV